MFSWYDEVQKIKRWIDGNIEEDVSLKKLSDIAGYSAFYLSKKFHQIEGITLQEYIVISKIQHAGNQLTTTDEKIINIALSHGYSSQEAFTRAFLKVFTITPWVYRKLQKPSPNVERSRLLHSVGFTKPIGGIDMKIYVKQMYDWNYYGYYAEDVDEKYWDYFKSELWWQVGNSFIKTYDNVEHFEYCADNFTKHGETFIKQQIKLIPTPWEKALDFLVPEMKKLGVDWFVHGSVAMALWGIVVAPRGVDIIIPNYSDFDKVKNYFCKYAIKPFERCENWLMSGLGTVFIDASIGFAFHNKELEPYDMSNLGKIHYNSEEIYLASLEMLKQDNENYNRLERVKMIEEKMNHNPAV